MKNSLKIIDEEFEILWEKDFGGHFDVIGKTDLKEIVQHFYERGCAQTKKEIGEYCYSQLDALNVCGNPIKLGKRDFLSSIMDYCENGDNYPVTEDEPSWKPSEELEEEVRKYLTDNFTPPGEEPLNTEDAAYTLWFDDVCHLARHFAEWGAEHLKK